MIPNSPPIGNVVELASTTQANKTYGIDFENKRILPIKIDNKEALIQAIYKMLATDRYEYVIYNYDYGVELNELIGQDKLFVEAELPRRVREALIIDDRIQDVKDFGMSFNKDELTFSCVIVSIYGEIPIERRVI